MYKSCFRKGFSNIIEAPSLLIPYTGTRYLYAQQKLVINFFFLKLKTVFKNSFQTKFYFAYFIFVRSVYEQ